MPVDIERPVIQDLSGNLVKRAVVGGKATTVTFDAQAKRIMEENKAIRSSGIVENKSEMRWALSMTPMQYDKLIKKYPELDCGDRQIQKKAWDKFIASSEAEPYEVT